LHDLASQRRRFDYRRLGLLLKRRGIRLNHKKLYRIYKEERLSVGRRGGRRRALGTRAPMAIPQDLNLRWSLDFVMDTLVNGRRFRILTLVDDFTRECLGLAVDTSLTGPRVVRELGRIIETRGPPHDRQRQRHRTNFKCRSELPAGARHRMALHRAREADAERVHRELQRPLARRVPQRAVFTRLDEAREIIEEGRIDYNTNGPHTNLAGQVTRIGNYQS
jgi:putative transposase